MKKALFNAIIILLSTSMLIAQSPQSIELHTNSRTILSKNEGDTIWYDVVLHGGLKAGDAFQDFDFVVNSLSSGASSSDYLLDHALNNNETSIRYSGTDTLKRVYIKLKNDGIGEPNDTFEFKLTTSPTGYSLGIEQQIRFIIGLSLLHRCPIDHQERSQKCVARIRMVSQIPRGHCAC